MFLSEALWIKEVLAKLALRKGQKVLDLAASTEAYRCLEQPYIDFYVFKPLRDQGINICYVDAKKDKGVDIAIDLMEPLDHTSLNNSADVILCCSLLEHVADRALILSHIDNILRENGVLILTVPYRYKYHPDPIDTMYRPSLSEIKTYLMISGIN
jgi:SAM-dependent methyltransferase